MSNTPKHDAYLSKDANTAAREMMTTIGALQRIYEQETEALENHDTQGFLMLQEDKLFAAQNYQRGIEELMARKDELKHVPQSTKIQLQEMQSDFSEMAKRNMKAIQRMQRVVERLGITIRGAAKEAIKKQRPMHYGESGTIEGEDTRSVSTGFSETV